MKLLSLLLFAAAWLAPGFAWPHNETVATGPLLDDPSDWLQSKLTDTGLAKGEQSPTPQPIGGSGHPGRLAPGDSGGRCVFTKRKVNSNSGASSWNYADEDNSLEVCNDWCATIAASVKAEGDFTNGGCIKPNDTPYFDGLGNEWSGS
jgi:hypothetical protein